MVEPTPEILSHHFSHEHPLEPTNLVPRKSTTCSGCTLTIFSGKYYYKCKTCPFYLHQVCHNMPKKVQHPSDPNRHLTLKSMPNSKLSVKCKACEHDLSGFFYNCNKCDDFYHILCSAVPLSVKTPSHQHILKLEYAPPYDFQCDLCQKPSYTGWLYRCSLCEFDVHLACAITNKGAQLLPHQMVPKSPDSLDRNINKQQELMELLTRGLSTKGLEEIKDGETEEAESNQFMPQDQQTPLPDDPSFMSYQFSDACFSIDFAKSLLGSHDGGMSQVSKGPNNRLSSELPEVIETEIPGNLTHGNNVIIVDHPKHKKQESVISTNVESTPSPQLRNSFNGLKISLSAGIGSHIWMQPDPETEKGNGTGFKDKSAAATDRRTSSDSVRMGCSCWSRGLMGLFYIRGYCRTSKSKKN